MPFKLFFFLGIIFSLNILSYQNQAKADFRPILGKEIQEKMLDRERTFWHFTNIDRFFFKPDGTFTHQINQEWGNIPLGTVIQATWRVKNDKSLCWTYAKEAVSKYKVADKELCFDLFTKTSQEEFMVGNHPDIRLKPEGKGAMTRSVFRFYSWHAGDYSFDPKYIDGVYRAMDIMNNYITEHNGRIPRGSVSRDTMNSLMQEYYDLTIGRVFLVNDDYMYFDPKGHFHWLKDTDMTSANGDIDLMLQRVRSGYWSVRDNIMCWEADGAGCEYMFPKGKGLKNKSFDTFLGTYHTGMTRVHHDVAENVLHLDFKDTPAPELFERLSKPNN